MQRQTRTKMVAGSSLFQLSCYVNRLLDRGWRILDGTWFEHRDSSCAVLMDDTFVERGEPEGDGVPGVPFPAELDTAETLA